MLIRHIKISGIPVVKNTGQKCFFPMENDKHIHFYGLFEDETLIATMKLIDFSINLFGKMQPATGLMALGVHPLYKKNKAALEMVKFFEDYAKSNGSSIAMLLPFRMDFYRKMGYGYGTKLDEYRIPTEALPKVDKEEIKKLRFLTSNDDIEQMLLCHSAFAAKNHGMAEKFEDEIRNIKDDTQTRRIGYFEDGRLQGYVAYSLICESDVNYTINRMEVNELVYMDGRILLCLLGYLKKSKVI